MAHRLAKRWPVLLTFMCRNSDSIPMADLRYLQGLLRSSDDWWSLRGTINDYTEHSRSSTTISRSQRSLVDMAHASVPGNIEHRREWGAWNGLGNEDVINGEITIASNVENSRL